MAVFAALGVGFMLVEVALFQKLMLLIGNPVQSLTTLLFALLLGSGIGSWISAHVKNRPEIVVAVSSLIAAVLTALSAVLVPRLPLLLDAGRLAWLLLIPLGVSLGFAFPLTVRLLRDTGFEDTIPWMWGVNGVGSLVGSSLAMVLGLLVLIGALMM